MISDYYHRQYSSQHNNTKTIKLKNHQHTLKPFMIPDEHFKPNSQLYQELKERCEKIKTEFSFIKSEIQREHKRKKEKQQEPLKLGKSIVNQQNRDEIQKQMTLTCKKLLKLHQFRKQDFQQVNNKRFSKSRQSKLSSLVGHTATFSPKKNSLNKTSSTSVLKPFGQSRFSLSNQ